MGSSGLMPTLPRRSEVPAANSNNHDGGCHAVRALRRIGTHARGRSRRQPVLGTPSRPPRGRRGPRPTRHGGDAPRRALVPDRPAHPRLARSRSAGRPVGADGDGQARGVGGASPGWDRSSPACSQPLVPRPCQEAEHHRDEHTCANAASVPHVETLGRWSRGCRSTPAYLEQPAPPRGRVVVRATTWRRQCPQ